MDNRRKKLFKKKQVRRFWTGGIFRDSKLHSECLIGEADFLGKIYMGIVRFLCHEVEIILVEITGGKCREDLLYLNKFVWSI